MRISQARVLWIESDPLSGGSQSQVEFPIDAGQFFGGSTKPRIGETFSVGLEVAGVRFLPKKMDCHHNDVWRLNLPTGRQGFGPYNGTIVCFEKTNQPGSFRASLVPKNAPFERRLRSWTRSHGRLEYRIRSDGSQRYMRYF